MPTPCLEIATYKVRTPTQADQQRTRAAARAQDLPGFAGWLPLTGADQESRADLVVWTSREAADDAAQQVGSGEPFAPFRATISEFIGMAHYALPGGGLPLMQAGDGFELGRFRLRAGVPEAALRAAHARMIESHLSRQPGWRGQRLLRLQDGTWLDLAFAASADAAETICASWTGTPECEAFLALIDPVSMEFGTIG